MSDLRKVGRASPSSRRDKKWPVLAALVIACVALAAFLRFLHREEALTLPSGRNSDILLFEAASEKLSSFRITPHTGESYILLCADGFYALDGNSDFPIDQALAAAMAEYLCRVLVEESVSILLEPESQVEVFGFASPIVTAEAWFTDGSHVQFSVGAPLPGGIPRDYFFIAGDASVYAVSVDVRETLDMELRRLHTVPRINFSPDLIDEIHWQGDQALKLTRKGEEWLVTAPMTYPADADSVRGLLEKIGKMRFASWVCEATQDQLVRYGFVPPRSEVRFRLAPSVIRSYGEENELIAETSVPEQELVIAVGNDSEGLGFYCLYDGSVYLATRLSMGFLADTDAWEYYSAVPIDISRDTLSHVAVRSDEISDYYDIERVERILPNNTIAVDEQGFPLFDTYVKRNSVPFDSASFEERWRTLTEIKADGRATEPSACEEKSLLSIRLEYSGGSRTVSFHRMDALHASVCIDGVSLFYVSLDRLQSLLYEEEPWVNP